MHEEHAKALADCLTALQTESRELERDPRNATAVRDYDFGIARIFQIIHDAKLNPWSAPLTIPSPAGDFSLTHKPDPRPQWNPALYEFTLADEFDVGGKYVTERKTCGRSETGVEYWYAVVCVTARFMNDSACVF
jgi:hypothetical protein